MLMKWHYSENPQVDYALRKDGYAVLNSYLEDKVEQLVNLYTQNDDGQTGTGFRVTFNTADEDTRRRVLREAVEVLQSGLGLLFADYRLVYANFIVKEPGHPGSAMPVHLDWAICDETVYRGLSTWVALTDVTLENGPMAVMPGSHLEPVIARGGQDAPFAMFPEFNHPVFADVALRYPLVPLQVPAGTVVPYDMRLFHSALPNQSKQPRIALNGVWVPRQSPLEHLFRDAEGNIARFAVDADFFHNLTPRRTPSTEPLSLTPAQQSAVERFNRYPTHSPSGPL